MEFIVRKRTVSDVMGHLTSKVETFEIVFGSFEEARRYVEKEYVSKLDNPKMVSNYDWKSSWRSTVEFGPGKKVGTEIVLKEKE